MTSTAEDHKVSVTPFLTVDNGKKAIAFYISAFGAKEVSKFEMPDGKISATLAIDGAEFYIGDEQHQFDNVSPSFHQSINRCVLDEPIRFIEIPYVTLHYLYRPPCRVFKIAKDFLILYTFILFIHCFKSTFTFRKPKFNG